MAPVEGDVTPLGLEVDLSDEMSNQFTPMECESESPVNTAWEALTQCLTHGIPLGWLGSILSPFPVMAPSPIEREG